MSKNDLFDKSSAFNRTARSLSTLTLEEYGKMLENKELIEINNQGYIADVLFDMPLVTNGVQLDLFIAYLETLRGELRGDKTSILSCD